MNLTKENALQAATGQPSGSTIAPIAPTPALTPLPATAPVDEGKAPPDPRKGESTRLDGGRRKSILGQGAGVLASLRCWRRSG